MSTITFLFSTGQVVAHCYYVYRTFAINNFYEFTIFTKSLLNILKGVILIFHVCVFYGKVFTMKTYIWASSWLKLHSHQTADQPTTNADQFLWLGRIWSGKKNHQLWLKSVSIPDQHPLYPRCIPDAPTLKSRSSRPTTVLLADQSPLCTTNPDLFMTQLRSI